MSSIGIAVYGAAIGYVATRGILVTGEMQIGLDTVPLIGMLPLAVYCGVRFSRLRDSAVLLFIGVMSIYGGIYLAEKGDVLMLLAVASIFGLLDVMLLLLVVTVIRAARALRW